MHFEITTKKIEPFFPILSIFVYFVVNIKIFIIELELVFFEQFLAKKKGKKPLEKLREGKEKFDVVQLHQRKMF